MRSIDELNARAARELLTNPTITVYTLRDGVEHRRPANPLAGLNAAMADFTRAAQAVAERFSETFTPMMERFQASSSPYTLSGIMTLRQGGGHGYR